MTFANVPTPAAVAGAALASAIAQARSAPGQQPRRVLAGYLAALIIGVALGLAIGRSNWAEDLLLPPLEVLRPIPAVAWIPLAILMFPSSELSMVFITFTGALFPILLNTVHGVEGVDPRLIASAKSLGAGRRAILLEVFLPGAAPSIITGLAIGMGTSWFCLVTAEMISGQFGIGYYTWESYTIQNYADIVVGMLLIGVLGMGSSLLINVWAGCSRPGIDHEEKPDERFSTPLEGRIDIRAALSSASARGDARASKRVQGLDLPDRAGAVRVHSRAVRLRQVHLARRPGRPPATEHRHADVDGAPVAGPSRARHGVPAAHAVSLAHGASTTSRSA